MNIFPDCYEVKNDYKLYGERVTKLSLLQSECENLAKSDPQYVGWSYSTGWATKSCFLLLKITGSVSGDSKLSLEWSRRTVNLKGVKLFYLYFF